MKLSRDGQSMIEVLVAVAIGALFIIAAAGLIAPSLTTGSQTASIQLGATLGDQLMNNVKVWSEGNWNNIFTLATSSNYHYYLNTSSSPFQAVAGDETVSAGSETFLRYFYVDDVYRNSSGNIVTSGGTYDPSTKKVTIGYRLLNESSAISSQWIQTVSSPAMSSPTPAFIFGKEMYILSFGDGDLFYDSINSTGSLANAWQTTSSFGPGIVSADAAEYLGYVYSASPNLCCGYVTSTMDYGKLSPQTGLASWGQGTPLPIAEAGAALIAYHGYLYVIGGVTTGTVFFAPINTANGSVGAWSSTLAFPGALASIVQNGIAYQGDLFVKPGTSSTQPLYFATLNSNGSIAAWSSTIPLNANGAAQVGITAQEGYLYASGGLYGGGVPYSQTSTVRLYEFTSSGALITSSTNTLTPLPYSIFQNTMVIQDPYIYNIGGANGTSSPWTVTSTIVFNTITRIGISQVSSTFSTYLTRNHGVSYLQSDWSGGPGESTSTTSVNNSFSTSSGIAYSSTTGEVFLALGSSNASSSFVQATSTLVITNNSGTNATFAASTTANNTIVVAAGWRGSQGITGALSDTAGNSYVSALGPVSAADGKTTAEIWYASGIVGGTDTVMLALSAKESSTILNALEYTNIASSPLDVTSWNSSTTGTSMSSGAATTSAASDLLFGFGITNPPTSNPSSSGQGFTSRLSLTAGMSEDEVTYGIGNYATTMSQTTSTNWTMLMVALKFTSQGSGGTSPNIASNNLDHWAWNDLIGWMDFYDTNTIAVGYGGLSGYASSSAGDISLDCSSTRSGDLCGSSDYQVVNNGSGELSGWAWNDEYGWISFFWGNNTSNPATSTSATCSTYLQNGGTYCGVYIDSGGNFQGYAWNDTLGWISFNCDNTSTCGVVYIGDTSYEVETTWTAGATSGYLDSTPFDTGVSTGAQLNSFTWEGTLPTNALTEFQFAVSNSSSGPWNFMGPSGDTSTWYSAQPSTPTSISYSLFNNFRYFEYQMNLVQGQGVGTSSSPVVTDVIINWSP